jgi:hypothetical protein
MNCTCYDPDLPQAPRKAHRGFCSICNDVIRVDLNVPCEIWRAALHHSQWNTYVCVRCFTAAADERGVEWCKDIQFSPLSRVAFDRRITASPVCDACNDTHRVHMEDLGDVMCTRCPTPCQQCRAGGTGAFCATTPCSCACHQRREAA